MRKHSTGLNDLQDDFKQFLLAKLTTSVQKLRNDHENSALQVEFCRRIEMVLFFGVKTRAFKWRSEAQDVWNLLKEISPNHIIEDIMLLKSVKTDIGRIRAWIRVTINEATLQSYIQLLDDHNITRKYYESNAVLNNRILLAEIVNLVSLITASSCKVIFNCDSFDFDVAPSALELHRSSLPDITASAVKQYDKEDTVPVQTSTESATISSTSVEVDVEPGPAEEELVTTRNVTPDTLENVVTQTEDKLTDEVPAVVIPDVQDEERSVQVNETENDIDVDGTSNISLGDAKQIPASTLTEDSTSPKLIDVRRSPESFLSSPEKCPIAEEETNEMAKDDNRVTEKSISVLGSQFRTATVINSVPLLDGVISEHLLNMGEDKLFTGTPSDSQLIESEPSTSNLATLSGSPTEVRVDSNQDSPLYSDEAGDEGVEGSGENCEGDVLDPGSAMFPDNLTTSSPIKTDVDTKRAPPSDLLPGTPKDNLICDEEIYDLRKKMGNSLQTSRDNMSEMLAQKVAFEDPYEDVRSAKSLSSSSHTSPFNETDSRDNILQLLEAEPDQTNGPAIPISDHSSPSQSAPHEPHSLGSSLYRLFSRGNTDLRTAKDENLSNLAEIHSAVVDDVPVSAEEQYSARNYLLGATRATASYTYESANQWYALSKDMWWWLQKRVIKEHECQHPVPPRDSQINGSPNSSLLDICTEQCACCNAIVIDYCANDLQDPDSIPVSRSCPPFSSISQHMMQSPRSPLQNPVPTLESLDRAIEMQKIRTQNTTEESAKKREMDILVKLRKKKHDLQNNGSDSSSENLDTTINILGHTLVKSSDLSGYCSKCNGAIYRRIKTAYMCSACLVILHKACINEVSRRCSLANKETLTLMTKIAPAHGLHEQNYCCYDCGGEISYSSTKVHTCDYNGRYYCQECHKKTLHLIPARVIHNWDFKPRQIALQSQEVISYLTDKEYLNIETLNPLLFDNVSVMNQLRELREKIIMYKAHFFQCSKALREGMFLKLKSRQHFIDTSKLYTLRDLVEANSGTLLPEVQTVVEDYARHVQDCDTCTNKKFLCPVCEAPPLISPFNDVYSIAQCSQCHGVLHRPCFNKSDKCPYCSASLILEL
ncbi:hypothetical protein ACHWQZ_G008769 [Mnemiopsis leidyi]